MANQTQDPRPPGRPGEHDQREMKEDRVAGTGQPEGVGQTPSGRDAGEDGQRPQGPPPTPFDHPLFLPALLVAGMVWFGYDGWINQDPDMVEHRTFNQVGFVVLTILAAWFGYKGWREWQADRAERDPGSRDAGSGGA